MSEAASGRDAASRAVMTLAAVVVVIAGLRSIGPVVLPLLTAAFIATVSVPVLRHLVRWRVPAGLAILLTCLLDVALLGGVGLLVGSSLGGLNEALPRYQEALGTLFSSFVEQLRAAGLPLERDELVPFGDAEAVIGLVTELAGELTSLASNVVLVVLLVVFLLFELAPFRRKLAILLGTSADLERFAGAAEMVQRYLFVKTWISLLVAGLCGLTLFAAEVDFALLWALATFLLNYVPNIGPALATIPSTAIALLTLGPAAGVAVGAIQLAIHVVVGNVLEPRWMGGALGLSTLTVFVSLLFWGWLWGPLGALFAVPLTLLLVSVFELSPETRWIAVLLASAEWVEEKRIEWGWPPPEERRPERDEIRSPLVSLAPKAKAPRDDERNAG
jgi:AI-2 transport protein TqsA